MCSVAAGAGAAGVVTLDAFGLLSPSRTAIDVTLRDTVEEEGPDVADTPGDNPDGPVPAGGEVTASEAAEGTVEDPLLPPTPTLAQRPVRPKPDRSHPDATEAKPSPSGTLSSWSMETTAPAASRPPAPSQRASVPRPAPVPGSYSLSERLAEISPTASQRLAARFTSAKVPWPPTEIGLVAIKDEKVLELHARTNGGSWQFVHSYTVLAASGSAGPKLRQGDKQVPEGVYAISFLNPNSRYHVSLRVNYPNEFDQRMAAKDGRKVLGGDIMIHGKNVSVGCLAVGDPASEELFVLAAQVGLPQVKLIIAPSDFRRNRQPEIAKEQPGWLPHLYSDVAVAMAEFKAPPRPGLLSFLWR